MQISNLGLKSKTKYKIDFTLVPLSILLIEIAIFITQFARESESSLSSLIRLRIVHTLFTLIAAALVWQVFKKLKKTENSYFTIAVTGVAFFIFGDLVHGYLASLFDIDLVSSIRRLGIILIQGVFWFPAIMIIGGNRKEILNQFQRYENRLTVATRAQSRTSPEFDKVRLDIQSGIQREFYSACKVLRESIASHVNSGSNLSLRYAAIAPYLGGDELRKLSRSLDTPNVESALPVKISKRRESLTLLIQQFHILYDSITRSTPLHMNSYAFMLIALATPPIINFYSLSEFVFFYPILLLLILTFARLIVKSQASRSSRALRNTSLLVFITGLLPAIVNLVGHALTHDTNTHFPLFISTLALPLVYWISMELLHVLRPGSLSLIRSDQLKASSALQRKIREIVREDFSRTISHQWAVFIHGKTLTRLAATSLKLKAAAELGDVTTFDQTLNTLISSLDNPDAGFEEEAVNLQTELSSRLDPWKGFVDIQLTIAEDLKLMQSPSVKVIGEVIEELLSNSIRHGKAKEIALQVIRAGNQQIDIIALDDATIAPDQSRDRRGLGTRIFNLASDGRWSISRKGSSTEFKLRMSID